MLSAPRAAAGFRLSAARGIRSCSGPVGVRRGGCSAPWAVTGRRSGRFGGRSRHPEPAVPSPAGGGATRAPACPVVRCRALRGRKTAMPRAHRLSRLPSPARPQDGRTPTRPAVPRPEPRGAAKRPCPDPTGCPGAEPCEAARRSCPEPTGCPGAEPRRARHQRRGLKAPGRRRSSPATPAPGPCGSGIPRLRGDSGIPRRSRARGCVRRGGSAPWSPHRTAVRAVPGRPRPRTGGAGCCRPPGDPGSDPSGCPGTSPAGPQSDRAPVRVRPVEPFPGGTGGAVAAPGNSGIEPGGAARRARGGPFGRARGRPHRTRNGWSPGDP